MATLQHDRVLPSGLTLRTRTDGTRPAFRMIDVVKHSGDIVPVRRDRFHPEWEEEREAEGEILVEKHLSSDPQASTVLVSTLGPNGEVVGRRATGVTQWLVEEIAKRKRQHLEKTLANRMAFNQKERELLGAAAHAARAVMAEIKEESSVAQAPASAGPAP